MESVTPPRGCVLPLWRLRRPVPPARVGDGAQSGVEQVGRLARPIGPTRFVPAREGVRQGHLGVAEFRPLVAADAETRAPRARRAVGHRVERIRIDERAAGFVRRHARPRCRRRTRATSYGSSPASQRRARRRTSFTWPMGRLTLRPSSRVRRRATALRFVGGGMLAPWLHCPPYFTSL